MCQKKFFFSLNQFGIPPVFVRCQKFVFIDLTVTQVTTLPRRHSVVCPKRRFVEWHSYIMTHSLPQRRTKLAANEMHEKVEQPRHAFTLPGDTYGHNADTPSAFQVTCKLRRSHRKKNKLGKMNTASHKGSVWAVFEVLIPLRLFGVKTSR